MSSPCLQIFAVIDGLAVGDGQRVQIGDLVPIPGAHDDSPLVREHDAADILKSMRPVHGESAKQLLHRRFALADHDDIGAGGEVLGRIVGAFRAAKNDGPARLLGGADNLHHDFACDQVRVDSQDAARAGAQLLHQLRARAEGAVVDLDVVPAALQVRRQVQQTQRRVGLHDLLLFRVIGQKVAVSQQKGVCAHVSSGRPLRSGTAAPEREDCPSARSAARVARSPPRRRSPAPGVPARAAYCGSHDRSLSCRFL